MAMTISAEGSTLTQALTTAVAGIVGCDEEKVSLRLEAPGLDDVTGTVSVELEIADADATPATEPRSEPDESVAVAVDEQVVEPDRPDESGQREHADGSAMASEDEEGPSAEELDEEADAAADFLEGLLDAIDLPGDLRIRVLEDHAEVEVVEIGSGALIGRRGQTLDAIQELVRCALQRQFERRCHVQIDAEGYRARRLEKLIDKAQEAIDDVLESGETERLEPMDVFERKAVHQLVARHEGVESHSQGREPGRRVVIEPV